MFFSFHSQVRPCVQGAHSGGRGGLEEAPLQGQEGKGEIELSNNGQGHKLQCFITAATFLCSNYKVAHV